MLLRILPMLATAATAVTAVMYTLAPPLRPLSRIPLPLALYLAAEAVAYVFVIATSSSPFFHNCQRRVARAAAGLEDPLETFRKCLDDPSVPAEEWITGWYVRKASTRGPAVLLGELRRGNVEEFIAWAQHSRTREALSPSERVQLETSVSRLEARIAAEAGEAGGDTGGSAAAVTGGAFRFPDGQNPELHCMRHNVDPPSRHILHRPLLYYLLTDGLFQLLLTPLILRKLGFSPYHVRSRRHRRGGGAGLRYWHHPGLLSRRGDGTKGGGVDGGAPPRTPVVFVHGVGFGLLPYTGWVRKLLHAASGAPVLLYCLPAAAQQLGPELGWRRTPAQADQATWEMALALRRHGLRNATFVGHSLGTITLAWLTRRRPKLVASSVFIDPICFLLHHAAVSRSFLYSRSAAPPQDGAGHGGGAAALTQQVENFFITSEACTVNYFHKHFHWFANVLFSDELAAPTAVILAEGDQFIAVERVRASLEAAMAKSEAAAPGRAEKMEVEEATAVEAAAAVEEGAAAAADAAVDDKLPSGGNTVRGAHYLRRLQTFPVGHGQFMFDGAARRAALKAVRDAQAWGSEARTRPSA